VTISDRRGNDDNHEFLSGGGEMGDRIARFDWAATGVGPIESWCGAMKSMLGFVLHSPVPIVTLWGDKGVMIYNDAYRSFAGGRHPALLGTNVLEGWHEVADFNANVMQKVYREGGTLSYKDQELTLIRDGTPKLLWTDLEYSPVLDEDGTPIGVVAIVIETTEKVLASRRLQDDRNRLWSISRDLLLVCTLDGTITAVNPSATRMLGWTEEEMVGHNLAEFIHPADLDRTRGEMTSLGEGISTLAFENRYRTRDGGYRLIAWTAVPDAGRVHAVGRDITEERHLARDRDRIWNLSPVLKVVTDAHGYITDVNPSWTEKLGWSREETLGRRSTDFMVDDEPGWHERVSTLRGGAPLLDYRTTLRTKNGDHRTIQWTTVPENDTFYGFGRDVTAELEAAAALADAEAALRQSQKMEAVGQLTGGIAHDFNNLLQGITGSLEIVQRRVAQGRLDELDRFISGASTAANRAAALTHRLLAFSRRQPLDPKPVRSNALVSSMEDLLRRTIGERIELELVLAGGLWVTKCDPNQLESAILNLAINARDAMPDGGKLIIETCNAHLDRAYVARQRGVRPGQYVCLCVSDTGIGMSQDTISKAFEPFFTTKPIGQGTGLGLSMIYGFAQQSEGYAKIYSELGQGTTFKLYLPRYRGGAEEEEEPTSPSAMQQAEEGEVVLVVEDESVVRGLILEELHELGYAALEAVDGASGLEMLRSKRRIDLLITDIGLPGLNGRQLADAARELRPSLKILFMTGYAENAALASGFLEPGMEMITKPFAMEALATRIRSMLTESS
jgi:PAS domain S-box-containing protein